MNALDRILDKDSLIVIGGAGGFIGGHLMADLRRQGFTRLRGVDIKPLNLWFQRFDGIENLSLDLRDRESCRIAADGAEAIFNLACDMGGMGFIETHKADCMLSVLINTHMLMAARQAGCRRYLYSSSACVYASEKQDAPDVPALKEADAYPAMPEDGYGWEKLFSERMCRHFSEDYGLDTRIVRLHNVYGPLGTYDGGREKAPAAISRKVLEAKLSGNHAIEIWGDGQQTRSFMYIDDCIHGLQALFASDFTAPINIGSAETVSINGLVDLAESLAGVRLQRRYDLSAPKGVRGRSSDNTLIRSVLGWEPSTSLQQGMTQTYTWIEQQVLSGGNPIYRHG
ncbi:NAD-dependent epimerase/dehydratase family protein [Magnetospirillum molischianum]|uniref:GDP-mannose 3,5-epimerase 1 n=1 Tax=Magnetospirillum molischianum DSM 120 TaxID=1150626 RepID=H8FSQ1_MAGML|nr:NAD-dependent epimerase/dehydratase family protein [Magnetospirillum molischianum]CCG41389.1 GDP-mannose 3,5-epimerase 1 [Magnetospirillum molischianum DSM 120]